MIKLESSVCIDTDPKKVWKALANLEVIVIWSKIVLHAKCEDGKSAGVGAIRECKLKGNLTIKDRWTEWDEGNSFKYEGFGLPMVSKAVNRWSVHAEGEKTLLKSQAEVTLKGGIFGRMLEPFMKPLMMRMAPDALKSFKYFAETGRPFEGQISSLPSVKTNC